MDIDELDEFDLQEIEAALYAKIHHEIYEECSGPTGEASSTALSSSCVTESYTAEDNFVAVQSHTAGHFRSLEEDAIYIIEEGSKYSVQSKCISSSSKATTVILSDSDEDIVCISANESNKNVIHIDSDSDVSIIPTEVNKDKPSVMKTRTGVSSFYKKKDDDPLTSGERSFLRLHFGFEKDKTELAKNKKKKQHVVFESDSDEEIHMRDITNLDSDISLNIEGTLASEHTNILRKIDAIVNQSVFVEQQDGEGDRVPRSWTDDMKQFYNNTKDLCDIDMAIRQLPKDKELWKIDPADKYKDFRRNRYFNTYKGRCSNCNQVGHPFRECPDPIKPIICSMCGGVGHNRFQCQLALCLQCGTRTPKYQEMCSRCRHDLRIICCICKMQGHGPVRCPDVWRRYHLSTEPGHVLAPCTPPQRLIVRKTGCCNCASKHHSVSSCPSRRESVLPLHLNETIFSYENPFCYDSEIPTIFKRKIDDEQIKEVDEPRKVVGNQDCDIAPRCVHYKIIDTYSLKFRKCIYDEVKKIWPTIALGKCPKRSSNSNTYLIHGIHIDGASRKIKKKVASYLENAFSFLRSISLTQGRKAVSQNMDSLVVENREALLNEHIRESPEWKELFYSLDRHVQAVTSRTAVKKKKMKKEKRIQHQHLFK